MKKIAFYEARQPGRINASSQEYWGPGWEGLKEAVTRYSPEKGSFSNFARYRIRGSILDYIRKSSVIPRSLWNAIQDEDNKINFWIAFVSRFTSPRHSPEGENIGWDPEDVHAFDNQERGELHEAILHILKELPDREAQVLIGYYLHDITAEEMAARFGVTKNRVWQIRQAALRHAYEIGSNNSGDPLTGG